MSKLISLFVAVCIGSIVLAAAFFPAYFLTGQARGVAAGILGLWTVAVVLKLLVEKK